MQLHNRHPYNKLQVVDEKTKAVKNKIECREKARINGRKSPNLHTKLLSSLALKMDPILISRFVLAVWWHTDAHFGSNNNPFLALLISNVHTQALLKFSNSIHPSLL